MKQQLDELKRRLTEINDLHSASAVLSWDQQTYMPPKGAPGRARQMATLGKIAHDRQTDPALGRLLDTLEDQAGAGDPDSDEAALIRVARKDFDRAVKIPSTLMEELLQHGSASYDAWTRARPANDFDAVRPFLERMVDLSRRIADCFPGYQHIADPLIDQYDPGLTAAEVRSLFDRLRAELVPLVEAIAARPTVDDACLRGDFDEAKQQQFAEDIIRRFGYDFERGRQDRTHHPFMIKLSGGDIRITTRFKRDDLGEALFSTLHEAGHALYEMGVDPALDPTPLADGTSMGVHESQSRLWENLVGRSRPFWKRFFPELQAFFPDALKRVTAEQFYRAINKVERSLIRTDADEVTYNLHVMIRFDLGLQLLEGTLAVGDLPAAWNDRMQSDLGLVPPDHRDGVLQDVHWFCAPIGGSFQCYTLGNILSAQFFDAAVRAEPGIPDQIARGEFSSLHHWLRENVYRHGRKYEAPEIVRRATGQAMTIEPYIAYLRRKYGEIYNL